MGIYVSDAEKHEGGGHWWLIFPALLFIGSAYLSLDTGLQKARSSRDFDQTAIIETSPAFSAVKSCAASKWVVEYRRFGKGSVEDTQFGEYADAAFSRILCTTCPKNRTGKDNYRCEMEYSACTAIIDGQSQRSCERMMSKAAEVSEWSKDQCKNNDAIRKVLAGDKDLTEWEAFAGGYGLGYVCEGLPADMCAKLLDAYSKAHCESFGNNPAAWTNDRCNKLEYSIESMKKTDEIPLHKKLDYARTSLGLDDLCYQRSAESCATEMRELHTYKCQAGDQ